MFGLVVILIGENLLEVVKIFVWGLFGYIEGVGYILFYVINFIFIGFVVVVVFYVGLFNIGGEG